MLHFRFAQETGEMMTNVNFGAALVDDRSTAGLVRLAVEKFSGAWLACFLVMARGDFARAFSLEHAQLASICGFVGAVVSVVLVVQMDRSSSSLARQMTISAFATFIGDVVAHPSHFPPQWAEPLVTAGVSAAIAMALWYAKKLAKRL